MKSIKTVVDVSTFKPISISENFGRHSVENLSILLQNNSVYAQRINKFRNYSQIHNIEFYNNIATYYVWFNTKRISDGGNFETIVYDEGF